jgi:hypothetical protein
MTRRFVVGMALVVVLAVPAFADAHDGPHKVMGTVTSLHEHQLEVKATDGKASTITLNEKTRVLRGKATATIADIKPGERIVVTAMETKGKDGKSTMVATEVRLAEAAQPASK